MSPAKENLSYLQRVLIVFLFALMTAALVWVLTYAAQALLVIFSGTLGAIFLTHISSYLGRHSKLSYSQSLAIVVFLLFITAVGTLYFLGSRIAEQAVTLVSEVQDTLQVLLRQISQKKWGQSMLERAGSAEEILTSAQTVARAGSILTATAAAITGGIITIFLSIYFAIHPDYYRDGLVTLAPPRLRERTRDVFNQIGTTLWWWILGRLVGMLVIGICSAIGLMIIGIPLAVELAVLAAVLTFIPNLGPVLSVVPPVLFGLEQGIGAAAAVVLLYLSLQAVESYLLTPLIEQHQVMLPPGVTLSSQIVFALLFGFFGVLLATPLAVVVFVIVRELYVKDTLEAGGQAVIASASP